MACLLARHHPTNLIETGIHLITPNEFVVNGLKDGDGVSSRVLHACVAIRCVDVRGGILSVGSGMRISAAANMEPAGRSGGTMEALERIREVPLG